MKDPGLQSRRAWTATHSAGFRNVGPVAPGGYRFGLLDRPRKSEQSTVSQGLKLERGKRYLLTFAYQTGYGGPHVGYQELFVQLNGAVIWRADLAVPGFPPPRARLLFDAPGDRVTLTFGKRGLRDSGQGWTFQSTVSDVGLRPATKTDAGEPATPARPVVVPVPRERRVVRITMADRFVRPGAAFSVDIRIRGAARLKQAEKAKLFAGLTLEFPGFKLAKTSVPAQGGRMTVTGRITRPGFFPLRVTLKSGGSSFAVQDYVVGLPEDRRATGAFDHHGYYVFLVGKGPIRGNRLAKWRLTDWKKLADWMHAHGADTLWMMLNCHWLAYPSKKYPALVDRTSANAQENFLKAFIDYAHTKQIKVSLAFTSDDYAGAFGRAHPETRRVGPDGKARSVSDLCPEHPAVRTFLLDVVGEQLELYPNADGIVIHPNESSPERFNAETKRKFRADTGKDFARASHARRYAWYVEQSADRTAAMYQAAASKTPGLDGVMFDCPWFDRSASVFKQRLPREMKVCVWHYLHHGTYLRNPKLRTWVEAFGKDRVIFMPNGFNYGYPGDANAQVGRHIGNDRLLSAAESLGYRSCVYYVHFLLDSEADRLRDLTMAKFPTSSFVSGGKRKAALVTSLHALDYYTARRNIGKAKK